MDREMEYAGNGSSTLTLEPVSRSAEVETDTPNLDRAVDVLASVLRETGKYAFDLSDQEASQITALYDAWAEHVLYAAPTPQTPDALALRNGRRDWVGLQSFVSNQSQREQHYINQTLSGIRTLVPQALEGIESALSGSEAADGQIRQQMETLKQAAQEGSLEALRREAFSVAAAVGEAIEERQRHYVCQIEALQAQLRDLNHQLKQTRTESLLDPLTRLDNRKAFDNHLEQTLELRNSFRTPACLLLVDADHFKAINDTYGHGVGDSVLKTLANCLARVFVSHEDCVARYGGEEFAVILRRVSMEDTRRLTERLMETVRAACVETGSETVRFTVSIGIAALMPEEDGAGWVARADSALYHAKRTGRNRVVVV